MCVTLKLLCFFFFFNDTATTEIYTLSLHDALPIYQGKLQTEIEDMHLGNPVLRSYYKNGFAKHYVRDHDVLRDRKSTRLNSSHSQISYAVFCLKKKNLLQDKLMSLAYATRAEY